MEHTRDNLPVPYSTPNGGFEVGDVVKVGRFFWIPADAHIDFDSDAYHMHGLCDHTSGSVDPDCVVTIRGFETWRGQRMAVVRLDRRGSPAGALAPNGQVFLIPISQMQQWPEMLEKIAAHESARAALAKKYKRVKETER